MRAEPVRSVRHRDGEPRPAARDQRGEDLDDGRVGACTEVGDLRRGHGRGGVREQPRPTGVVQVVARAIRVTPGGSEAGDPAEDCRLRYVDAQAFEHAGPEAVEDDVRAGAERVRELEPGV